LKKIANAFNQSLQHTVTFKNQTCILIHSATQCIYKRQAKIAPPNLGKQHRTM